jgi:hypothetical protein
VAYVLPIVRQRVSLTAGGAEDEFTEAWEGGITDVTVLARDLEESIWTVWDHTTKTVKMISFDENKNWAWVEPCAEATDDQT